jgi:hypothetical protein
MSYCCLSPVFSLGVRSPRYYPISPRADLCCCFSLRWRLGISLLFGFIPSSLSCSLPTVCRLHNSFLYITKYGRSSCIERSERRKEEVPCLGLLDAFVLFWKAGPDDLHGSNQCIVETERLRLLLYGIQDVMTPVLCLRSCQHEGVEMVAYLFEIVSLSPLTSCMAPCLPYFNMFPRTAKLVVDYELGTKNREAKWETIHGVWSLESGVRDHVSWKGPGGV